MSLFINRFRMSKSAFTILMEVEIILVVESFNYVVTLFTDFIKMCFGT